MNPIVSPVIALTIAISSLSWSLFDLSRKKLAVDLPPVPVVAWLMIFQALMFLAFAPFDSWGTIPVGTYIWPFIASVALNAFANIWFVEAVALAPFSLAIPILSLTPVFSTIGGIFVLNEAVTARQALGIGIIVAATLAIGFFGTQKSKASSPETKPDAPTTFDAASVRKGLGLMAVVALLFALTPVVDKLCLRNVPASEHGFLQCLATAASLGVWIKIRGGGVAFSRVRTNLTWFISAILFATLAVYFQFYSIQSVPVGIFEALKRSFGLIAALTLGYFMFREPVTKLKAGLVLLMGVGIFVLLA
jgi:drug/metabolite transporter (DMT)-like permease